MPTCCVPGCASGYPSQPRSDGDRITFHKFPADDERRRLWIRKIHRDFTPSDSHRVCSLHFVESDFKTSSSDRNKRRKRPHESLQRRYLSASAYPSVLPNLPNYLSTQPAHVRSASATSTARLEAENQLLAQQIAAFEQADIVDCLDDIEAYVVNQLNSQTRYDVVRNGSFLFIVSYDFTDTRLTISTCISVNESLHFSVSKNGTEIESKHLTCMQYTKQLIRFSDLENLLSLISNYTVDSVTITEACDMIENYVEKNDSLSDIHRNKYHFLIEQLNLVEKPVNRRRYSTNCLIQSLLWQSFSTSCYRSLIESECLTLPSIGTLRSLSSGFQHNDATIREYLLKRRNQLSDMESNVLLVFDEIYVFQRPDYHNGRFYGLTTKDNEPAKTVLVFLISSISSSYNDVIGMVPLTGLTTDVLKDLCEKMYDIVQRANFRVIGLCSDNHAVNRSFFVSLGEGTLQSEVEYPINSGVTVFVIIDPIHTLKNIYNNFQRAAKFEFPFDGGFLEAQFSHIKDLFSLEANLPVKLAHKLNSDCLDPSNIQRSSFKHFAAVFHESTVHALQFFKENSHPEWHGTYVFVKMIHDLFCIINVKTPHVGHQKRDDYREPVDNVNCVNIMRLNEFLEFFNKWEISKKRGLSQPTSAACRLMCESIFNISRHLLTECNFLYVLLGKIQSDIIEKRFGKYRQMSGSNYFISVRQLMESEKKLKIHNFLAHCNMSVSDLSIFRQCDLNEDSESDSHMLN